MGIHFPLFAISKKYRALRVFTDFRKLNLLLKCHPFSIPKIGNADMIHSMEGSSVASAMDLSMVYYHIKLDDDAQKISTIVFPRQRTNTNAYPWVSILPGY
jgi:hypothetical protein